VTVTTHPRAACCWCKRALVQYEGIYWCPNPPCAQAQIDHAVVAQPKKGPAKLLYVPTPKQVEFDRCPAKYVLYGGAAGPGKSHAARWALYRRALKTPGFEALLLRKTFPELEKTHLRRMASEVPMLGGEFIESKRLARFRHKDGRVSLIECGHMDDDNAVSKYLSSEYDVIVPDEGSTFDPQALLELSTRARSSKPEVIADGGAKFWVVSNPGGPASSMLLDFFIDQTPDYDAYPALRDAYDKSEWTYIPGLLDDNPYMDPAYERQLAVLPKWRYEQLRFGDWRVFAGQFFSEWNERHHVAVLEPAREGRWFRSLDWGRNQPGCVLWWAVLPDHRLYVRKEWKFQGRSEEEVAAGIKKIDSDLGLTKRPSYTAGDPAVFNKTGATHTKPQFVGQSIGESLGFYGVPITKADHDRFNGWMRCHALLRFPEVEQPGAILALQTMPTGTPWLQVHPECRYLIRSIAAAVSDDKDPDDVDTKTDDHALDAWRYGAMSRPNPASKSYRPTYAAGTMGALRQGRAA
jgi:phage terminase large subunit